MISGANADQNPSFRALPVSAADQLSVIVGDDRLFEAFQNAAQSFLTVQSQRFDFAGIGVAKGVELKTLGCGATAVGSAMRGLPWAA